jgi:hypothetical protein
MKLTTRQIHGCTENSRDFRRRTQAQLAAIQTVTGSDADGLNVGRGCRPARYMPRLLAPLFIARIEKLSAFRSSLPVAHVR